MFMVFMGEGGRGGNLAGGRCLTLWGILTPAPTPDPLVGNNPFIFPDSKFYRLVVRYNFLQTFSVKGKLRKIFKIFEGWGLGGWSLEPLLGLGGPLGHQYLQIGMPYLKCNEGTLWFGETTQTLKIFFGAFMGPKLFLNIRDGRYNNTS